VETAATRKVWHSSDTRRNIGLINSETMQRRVGWKGSHEWRGSENVKKKNDSAWSILRYHYGIHLQRLGATAKNLVQDSRKSAEIRTRRLRPQHNSRKLPLQAN
jgi:hypothetical protein